MIDVVGFGGSTKEYHVEIDPYRLKGQGLNLGQVTTANANRNVGGQRITLGEQLGRPDDGTDVSGFYNIELLAPLRPNSEWRSGITKESMTEDLSKELRAAFAGVDFNFSQACRA